MSEDWRFLNATSNFSKYKEHWQQLCENILGLDHPILHMDYVESLVRCFSSKNVILALKGRNGTEGMALLQQKHWGVWESFCPGTGPISFSLIRGSDNGYADASISALLRALPGVPCLLAFYKLDPNYLTVKAKDWSKNVEQVKYMETIKIPIDQSFDDYWSARGKNLKRDIIKKKRRIEKAKIKVNFRELRLQSEMKSGVETYGNFESSGWKGKMGTAVHIDNHRGAFYTEMLRRFASRGKASIFQLLFNGKVVASALTIMGGDMIVILKITYDESIKKYSPGLMMMYELHKNLFSTQRVGNIEYYGNATKRQKQWANNLRTMYHLNYYRAPVIKDMINIARKVKDNTQISHLKSLKIKLLG